MSKRLFWWPLGLLICLLAFAPVAAACGDDDDAQDTADDIGDNAGDAADDAQDAAGDAADDAQDAAGDAADDVEGAIDDADLPDDGEIEDAINRGGERTSDFASCARDKLAEAVDEDRLNLDDLENWVTGDEPDNEAQAELDRIEASGDC